jgi:DNA-binding SARP family transcriptional activator
MRYSLRFTGALRLRFGGDVEPSFDKYHDEHSLPRARLALVLAPVLYALFGVLDRHAAPDAATATGVISYMIFCPLALAVLRLSFANWFRSVMQLTLAAVAALAGLGIVAMIAIAGQETGYLYYAGLLLAIQWTYTVLPLRFWHATAACLAVLAGYELVVTWLKPTTPEILINNNFFLLSAVIIAMAAGYSIERSLRTDFLQRRVIEAQRAELQARNTRLATEVEAQVAQLRRQAAELAASRARIVAAADAERHRTEHNQHDGAQQRLTALAVKLDLAAQEGNGDPGQQPVCCRCAGDIAAGHGPARIDKRWRRRGRDELTATATREQTGEVWSACCASGREQPMAVCTRRTHGAGLGRDSAAAGDVVALLGPVEIGPAGGVMAGVAQPRLRVLLGLLAVAAGRVVSVETLVDGVWGEEWSPRRERNLHALVYQLRRRLAALESGRGPDKGGGRLTRVGPGYRLVLGAGELDVAVFKDLAGRGRAAARSGDATGARELLGQALGLWRGTALADAAPLCPRLAGEADGLEEARLAVVEERIECDLALGRHTEVPGELAGLVAQFPLRERLAALLMTALYRCGRRGEALAVYDRSRLVLAEELGLDPGPELTGLQARVLADDPVLAALPPAALVPAAAPGSGTPTVSAGSVG